MLEYHAAYHRCGDGWYWVEVLDFPGVISQGRTLNSARRMIRDALRMMAEWYVADGKALPLPNAAVTGGENPDYQELLRVRFWIEPEASSRSGRG
jgi:predicted RNase H-like HicB family nuclease